MQNLFSSAARTLARTAAHMAVDATRNSLMHTDGPPSRVTRHADALLSSRLSAPLVNNGRVLRMRRRGGRISAYFAPAFGMPARRRSRISAYRGYTFGRRRRRAVNGGTIRRRAVRAVIRMRRLTRIRRARKRTFRGGQLRIPTHNVSIGYKRPRSVRVLLGRRRRRGGWYRLGKWFLTGDSFSAEYSNQGGTNRIPRNQLVTTFQGIQVTTASADLVGWEPLGFIQNVYIDDGTNDHWPATDQTLSNAVVNTSSVCFNYVVYAGAVDSMQYGYTGLNPASINVDAQDFTRFRYVAPWVYHGVCNFFYSSSSNASVDSPLGLAWTPIPDGCRVPPLPSKVIDYVNWPQRFAPGQAFVTSPTTSNFSLLHRSVPYSMVWSYVYARFRYSIKVRWPQPWATLYTSNPSGDTRFSTVLPNNPPLIVRLIGVRYMESQFLSSQYFARYFFPVNGSIRSKMERSCRTALWNDYKGVVFFEKTFSFNGQLVPKSSGEENLLDGQEGVFTVRCPYKFRTTYLFPFSSNDTTTPRVYYPTFVQGRVLFYCYAALDNSMWLYNVNTGDWKTADAIKEVLTPAVSIMFQPTYFCYPKVKAPNPRFLTSSAAQNARAASSYMALSPITGEAVSLRQANEECQLDQVTIEKEKALYLQAKTAEKTAEMEQKETNEEVSQTPVESLECGQAQTGSDTPLPAQ